MRIALISVSLRGGGTERIVCRIANHLGSAHEVAVITLAANDPFFSLRTNVLVKQPAPATAGSAKPLRLLRQAMHLHNSVRDFRPDLTMIFGEDIAPPATLIVRSAGAKRFWNFFRGRPERSIKGLKGRLNRLFCSLSERILVQTSAGKGELSDFYPVEKWLC